MLTATANHVAVTSWPVGKSTGSRSPASVGAGTTRSGSDTRPSQASTSSSPPGRRLEPGRHARLPAGLEDRDPDPQPLGRDAVQVEAAAVVDHPHDQAQLVRVQLRLAARRGRGRVGVAHGVADRLAQRREQGSRDGPGRAARPPVRRPGRSTHVGADALHGLLGQRGQDRHRERAVGGRALQGVDHVERLLGEQRRRPGRSPRRCSAPPRSASSSRRRASAGRAARAPRPRPGRSACCSSTAYTSAACTSALRAASSMPRATTASTVPAAQAETLRRGHGERDVTPEGPSRSRSRPGRAPARTRGPRDPAPDAGQTTARPICHQRKGSAAMSDGGAASGNVTTARSVTRENAGPNGVRGDADRPGPACRPRRRAGRPAARATRATRGAGPAGALGTPKPARRRRNRRRHG